MVLQFMRIYDMSLGQAAMEMRTVYQQTTWREDYFDMWALKALGGNEEDQNVIPI